MSAPSGGKVVENNSVDENAVLVQGGKCTVTAMRSLNTTAAAAYVQYFDAAAVTDVTVGTTVARWWIVADTQNQPSLGDGLPSDGLTFENGVVIASTTAHTGNTGAAQHVRTVIK